MQNQNVFRWLVLCAVFAHGCGQAPSFMDMKKDARSSSQGGFAGDSGANGDLDATALDEEENGAFDGEGLIVDGDGNPEGLGGDVGDSDPSDFEIPDASDEDLDALHKCMAQWKDLPFNKTIDNFTKISAAVTVGGYGFAINDTERTDEPWLTLISAGVNVLGEPTYRLLNPNGYYCIKVNVNALANLTVELHCNARLADQKVNVNVLSDQNDTTSAVGVHVLSNVEVVTVRPSGDDCVR